MAKLRMKRIEIAALLNDRKNILERLQRRGIIEINDYQDGDITKIDTSSFITQFEKSINTAVTAKEILGKYATVSKSMFAALNPRKEIEKKEFGRYVEQRERYLKHCYDLIELDKSIAEHRAAIVRTQTLMDSLQIWRDLDIPMYTRGTKSTRFFVGVFPRQRTCEDILSEIGKRNPQIEALAVDVVSSSKEQTCAVVICHKSVAEALGQTLREMEFVIPSELPKQEPTAILKQYENDLKRHQESIDGCISKIQSATGTIEEMEFLIDYYTIRKDKYVALGKTGLTKNTFVLRGYIPKKNIETCVAELESKYTIAIEISEPEENEEVPVLLENNGFSAPVESITAMYALPGKKDVDPSPVMAFFYYMFFGIMLSDAGYGLLMVISTAIVLKAFKPEGSLKKSLKMFFFSGISTIFWGALFGSWFGDVIPVIYTQFLHMDAPNLALWFEPISDPIRFLLAAFGFGIAHLFVGLGVHFRISWSQGNRMDALSDVIPIYLMVAGAAPLGASVLVQVPEMVLSVGQYMALAGVILVILTAGRKSKNIFAKLGGGLYGLYNAASGYLSDILSYSRLLALGLATSSIASVINLMGSMPENLVVKGISLTVVFLIGHPLNMAINLLGAYVHTNRLQFVEFFSKFYEGGGRAFNPLKINSKYIKFKEEI